MGFLNKFMKDYDDYDDFEDYLDDDFDDVDDKPKKSFFKTKSKDDDFDMGGSDRKLFGRPRVTEMPRQKAADVCVLKPQSYNDAPEISDALLNGRAVILNLEGLTVDIAQRLVDFATGACVIIDGSFKSVSAQVFVITPRSIEINGGMDDLLLNNFGIEK